MVVQFLQTTRGNIAWVLGWEDCIAELKEEAKLAETDKEVQP
jgi:hypothetical protein